VDPGGRLLTGGPPRGRGPGLAGRAPRGRGSAGGRTRLDSARRRCSREMKDDIWARTNRARSVGGSNGTGRVGECCCEGLEVRGAAEVAARDWKCASGRRAGADTCGASGAMRGRG
jgi:hypothetical protein